MPRRIIFTEAEKEEDIKDIETMLRENPNCHDIAKELGRSVSYICDIKVYLNEQGILTTEELEQIALEKIDEKNREFDKKVLNLIKVGKNKNKIRKILQSGNRRVDKSYARLSKVLDLSLYQTEEERIEQERLTKIKDFVNNGEGVKYYAEIAEVTDIPFSTVKKLVQILIDNGSIKAEDVINKFEERKEKASKRNEEIYVLADNEVPVSEIAEKFQLTTQSVNRIIRERNQKQQSKSKESKKDYDIKEPDSSLTLQEKRILEYLKKGLFYTYICKKEELQQNDLMKLVSSLKDRKYITQTIINEAREIRRKYYMDTIESLLMNGLKPPAIYKEINKDGEEITRGGIDKFIQKLITSGRTTQEEIENARAEQENSFASIDRRISPLIKKGYTTDEIIATDETGFLTEGRVRKSKKRIIASENITKEQLEKWRKKREQQKKNEAYTKDEKIIWYYVTEYGYDDKDIATLIDAGVGYVGQRRRAYQNKKGISNEKFHLIKAQGRLKRKQREEQEETKKRKLVEYFYKIKKIYQKEYYNSLPKLKTMQNYFNLFMKASELGILKFTKEDVDILSFIVLYKEEFQTDENIKYVMEKYLSINEKDEAMKLLNRYINSESRPLENDVIIKMRMIIQNYKQRIN